MQFVRNVRKCLVAMQHLLVLPIISHVPCGKHMCDVMVSVHASNWTDRGFELLLGQTNFLKTINWYLLLLHSACSLSKKQYVRAIDWLSLNQDNVSKCSDMSTR